MSKLKVCFVSNYPPSQCGISTYTRGLVRSLSSQFEDDLKVYAVAPKPELYPPIVEHYIGPTLSGYRQAAAIINQSDIDVINIQHEYGIYAGEHGDYLLDFVRALQKPYVLSLHTVVSAHPEKRFLLTKELIARAAAVVVMTQTAKAMLIGSFDVDLKKIVIIPHGAPDVPFDGQLAKQSLGLSGKTVVATFGLLNPNKGIEHAIEALAQVKKNHNLVYFVLGKTHPVVYARDGNSYLQSLINLRDRLGLTETVRFIDSFIDYEALLEYLKATDIYLAPQKDLLQAFSGTVTYAMAAAAAVIGTPTVYNNEVLADHRGITVPVGSSRELAVAINDLLAYPRRLYHMKLNAYQYTRMMTWPVVARRHRTLFANIVQENFHTRHLRRLTTGLGIVQHAAGTYPNFLFGYSIDDQSRGLITAIKWGEKRLARIYLDSIAQALRDDGWFHNFSNWTGQFVDQRGSPDSYGRTLWALGEAIKAGGELAEIAKPIFEKAAIHVDELGPIRSRAFALLGLAAAGYEKQARVMATTLVDDFADNATPQWRWFEDILTYDNAMIPLALAKTGSLSIAQETFDWLNLVCRIENAPAPIGQDGWYQKDGKRALFDQQPVDAAAMVLTACELYQKTGDSQYHQIARDWMAWYQGNNIHGLSMIDPKTSGVYDGLTPNGVNLNQGAESIVTYLLARHAFEIVPTKSSQGHKILTSAT